MMGIEPTGTAVTYAPSVVHRMEDGFIAERWGHPDIVGILARLGAIDRPGESVYSVRATTDVPHTPLVVSSQ